MPSAKQRLGRALLRARLDTTKIDPIRSREVRPMLQRLELEPQDAVLDLGCAAGVWTNHLSKRVRRAVGVDPDEAAISAGHHLYPRPTLLVADARALPFADGEFDKAVFISTLEHIEDPGAALREVARVLKPGGRLALSVDTLDHPAWRPLREVHARRSFVVQYFSRDEIVALARECGFELVWGRYLYGNDISPRLLKWRLEPSSKHWLVAPAVRLSGVLDVADAGMMFQSVMRRQPAA